MSQDTRTVSSHYAVEGPTICSSTVGETNPEATAQGGFVTFNIEEWLGRERLFETTVARIIIFSGFLFFIVGAAVGVYITRNNPRHFIFEGRAYSIVGVGEMNDGNKKIYTPVYEVKK